MNNEPFATQVTDALTRAGLAFTISGGARTERDKWECFAWRAEFRELNYYGPRVKAEFDYYTGVGNVKPLSAIQKASKHIARPRMPLKPGACDVLASLLLDARAIDESFEGWADGLGLDTDSRKVFATYEACCDIGKQLRKLFTHAQREELQTILQDY